MTRARGFILGAALAGLIPVAPAAQTPAASSKPRTIAATIEAIDQTSRIVTLKGPNGNTVDLKAPDEMQGFKSLKVGDQVTASYFDAVAVRVRKPGDPAPSTTPVTTTNRKDRVPGSETRRQQTFTVTIEAIDEKAPSVQVRGAQGRVQTLPVRDPAQLQHVKVGDTVDVTYYESLLVKVARAPKKD